MPFATDDGDVIRPDFYLPRSKVVVEYYGLLGDQSYERGIEYKRKYWAGRRDLLLIELPPGFVCPKGINYNDGRESDYQKLSKLLVERTAGLSNPISPQKLSDAQILARLRDQIRISFVDLVQSALTRALQLDCSEQELAERLSSFGCISSDERSFLDLLPVFLAMYHDRLTNNNLTDFNLLKKQAILQIASGSTSLAWDQGRNSIDLGALSYIFVDEFQDFSELFRGLLLAIKEASPNSLVNAVGDYWQMINRFAGSKPELFDRFELDFPNSATKYLLTNYRSSGDIVDFCNMLMSSNGIQGKPALACGERQSEKHVIAKIDRDELPITPCEEHWLFGDPILSSVFRLYGSLSQLTPFVDSSEQVSFLVLSRTNDPPLRMGYDEMRVLASNKREVILSVFNRLFGSNHSTLFDAKTSHKSKGLESDVVIVLQPRQYPCIHQRSMFLRFFGDTLENLWRDELNLFYVTCSRARRGLFFLPEHNLLMSPFLQKVSGKIDSLSWDQFPCHLESSAALHTIMIQGLDQNLPDLRLARDVLLSLGFGAFTRPSKIPTRSKLLKTELLGTLEYLSKVLRQCSEFRLRYTILDGLNRKIFSLPGPISIQKAINTCRGNSCSLPF